MPDPLITLNRILAQNRWTEREAREVLAAHVSSGLSVPKFAAQHSIPDQRIYFWRQRLESAVVTAPKFVEVAAREAPSPTGSPAMSQPRVSSARYEVVLAHGESLRIEGPIDPTSLRTLLAVLREGRKC